MFKLLFTYYNNLIIAKKLRFLALTTAYISGVIIIVSFMTFQYFYEKRDTILEANVFAQILADNMAQSILTKNVIAISNTLASTEHNPKIRQAFAFDKNWKMLGAFHKGYDFYQKLHTVSIIQKNQNLWYKGYYYSVAAIMEDETSLGYLVVVASLHDFYIEVIVNSLVIALIILFALLITHKFRKKLQDSILLPIAQLDSITTEVIRTKNLDHKIPYFYNDEIGVLAQNFNFMLDELNAYQNELNAKKDILSYQANHDVLTKLPNRALFNDRLHQSIYKAARNKEEFALLFLDLDNFKEINDTFGHNSGDDLLLQVSRRLKTVVREEDSLARLGGDEFTIIVHNIKEKKAAAYVAQKILDTLEHPFIIFDQHVHISCSVGISLYPQDSLDATELLKNADIAMYHSKDMGKNNYKFYKEDMAQKVYDRVTLHEQIQNAVERREFVVYYQPQYNALTGVIVGFEALVRWNHPQRNIVMPSEFIEFSEEFNLIADIGNFVLKDVMRQLVIWRDQALYFGKVSVNISISQIEHSDFVTLIKDMFFETGCDPRWMIFEITEGQMMKNPEAAIITLDRLNQIGIEVSLDDFGTGHSSLAYLKRLPVHELKIDKSFISDIPQSLDDTLIVEAIIALAQSLKLQIVVEGVETLAQKEFLLSKECYTMQGYFFARPASADETTKRLVQAREVHQAASFEEA